jgi:hypothetical protein
MFLFTFWYLQTHFLVLPITVVPLLHRTCCPPPPRAETCENFSIVQENKHGY